MTERPSRIVTADALRDFIVQLLQAAGCLDEAAKITADVLIEAAISSTVGANATTQSGS